jgi:hypothetical protein
VRRRSLADGCLGAITLLTELSRELTAGDVNKSRPPNSSHKLVTRCYDSRGQLLLDAVREAVHVASASPCEPHLVPATLDARSSRTSCRA